MEQFLAYEYYGNTVLQWVTALGIVLGGFIGGKILYWVFGNIFKKLASKTKTNLDEIIIDMVEEPVAFMVVLVSFWYARNTLTLSEGMEEFSGHALQFVAIMNLAWLLTRLFEAIFEEYIVPIAAKSETDLDDQILPIVRKGTKTVIWLVSIIIGLDNSGFDVGAAIAGLGIGGVALAMAGKDTVSNMFGGLTVFMDGPFKLGDRIKVSGIDGSVLEIGLRSTRIQTLEGRIVTVPNSTFSDSPVENVSMEPSRKVPSTLGLTYDMTAGQMREALEVLRKIAEAHEGTEEKIVVAFSGFGDFSMNLTFVYWIKKDADIMGVQTEINLAILEQFAEHGLDMAFPTQTIITQPS